MVSEELRLRSVAHRKLNPPNHPVRDHGRQDPLNYSLKMTAAPACKRQWDETVNAFLFVFITYLFLTVLGLRCWAQALSSCSEQGLFFLPSAGFSDGGAWALWAWASGVAASRLSICGARAQLLYSMGNLPRLEVEPVSLVLTGELLTTGPPKESQ